MNNAYINSAIVFILVNSLFGGILIAVAMVVCIRSPVVGMTTLYIY